MDETPKFIEVGDPEDVPRPIPIFVTRSQPDRSHAEALRAQLTAENAVDELAVLDNYEQPMPSA
ncbi:hypothetical protein A9817_004778 [Escherichia coli]|nr:hypothetical protein [Escherichia coli]